MMSQEAMNPVPPVTQTNPVPSNNGDTVSSPSFLSPPPLLSSSSFSSLPISMSLLSFSLSLLWCVGTSKGFLNNGTYVIYSLTPIRVTCSPFCPLLSLLQICFIVFLYIRYINATFYRSFILYYIIIHILCPFITNIVIGFRYFSFFHPLCTDELFLLLLYTIVLASSGGMY